MHLASCLSKSNAIIYSTWSPRPKLDKLAVCWFSSVYMLHATSKLQMLQLVISMGS